MLDTNIVSDLIRNPQGKVAKRIAKLGEGNICTSVIVAAELRYGCAKSGSKRLLKAVEDLLGWEFVHVCIDDHSRVAFTQIKPDEKADSAVPFLKAAVAYYKSLGVTVTRVMTDNGSCYKAFAFRDACRDLGIKHIRTKPYTPKTNGKAERFIQTALREWAYAQAYPTSDRRAEELPIWLHRYNWHRPHGGIQSKHPSAASA
jgi:transposase InsO family protein